MNTLEIKCLVTDEACCYVVWEGMTPREVCALVYPGSPMRPRAAPIRTLDPRATYRQAWWVEERAPSGLLPMVLACLVELP